MKPLPNPLLNIAPRNRTQTSYTRFLKQPGGEIRTAFSESRSAFRKTMDDAMKSPYDEFWRQDEGGEH